MGPYFLLSWSSERELLSIQNVILYYEFKLIFRELELIFNAEKIQ